MPRPSARTDAFFLLSWGVIFAFTVVSFGGVTRPEWSWSVLALAAFAVLLWGVGPVARLAPALSPLLLAAALVAPLYVALQMLPLPPGLLRLLSPGRAGVSDALAPLGAAGAHWIPLTVDPWATAQHFVRLLAYLVTFLAARELGWRYARRRWILTLPVLCVALAEAALGLFQYRNGAPHATGTYVNPNHFAGLLELSLPFAVMYSLSRLRRLHQTIPEALLFIALWAGSLLLFLGVAYSLSRSGLAATLISMVMGIALLAARSRARWLALLPVALCLMILLSVPIPLLDRLSSSSAPETAAATGEISAQTRLRFWRETLLLVRDYPVFGCGLGTYVSAIQKYRSSAPLSLLDYAHNDYLQLLAELGLAGFVPGILLAAWFLVRIFRTALDPTLSTNSGYLAIACATALVALAVHSLTDFNLYIPANAMLAAWVAGIAGALEVAPERVLRKRSSTGYYSGANDIVASAP